MLSVALWYHFGFLVIATALLGFGTAGVVLAVWPWLREQAALDRLLALLALGFGVLTIAASGCCNSSPDRFSLFTERRQVLFMALYYVLLTRSFMLAGTPRMLPGRRRLYPAVMLTTGRRGAGLRAVCLVMPAFGGSGAVLVAATLGLLGGRLARRMPPTLALTGALLSVAAVALVCVADRAVADRHYAE